ncbi:dynamin family protein [uncultured Campylobacter sp.]|uniref:dynamin family protein n=1 Tax=uncultured Campylobacter sp. TaxID=218934 RepID=UPI0028E877DB|nr:dynamin family protein [uncultured Campylobacter sp.]
MNIVKFTKELEAVIAKYDLDNEVSILKQDNTISKSSELEAEIESMQKEGRTLKLGIIGRVKSGKSSLINALIFDGEDVLPKAATPMTAALTVLKYGQNLEAQVDFFSEEDLRDIKDDAASFQKRKNEIAEAKFNELTELEKRKLKLTKKLDEAKEAELRKRAVNIAEQEMRNNAKLSAAAEQYERIERSGVNLANLEGFKNISAANMDELNRKLYDFVGADGKYMPFTKSVTLKLDKESLKDIEIIDTPGVNDPVVSREERTKQLLKTCDVVLVVSPSGQFLSSEDTNLLDRVTKKDGIREVYLVASQVDNQLFGGEKEKGGGVLSKVLENIRETLSIQQSRVLKEIKAQSPEVGDSLNELIDSKVLLSSATAFYMMKNYDDQGNWDLNSKHVWGNLNHFYRDYFDDKQSALANLNLLSGIKAIEQIISKVKDKKEEILQKRSTEFISVKFKNLLNYQQAVEQQIQEKMQILESSDINEIKHQREQMIKIKSKAVEAVNNAYEDSLEGFEINIKDRLFAKVESYFKKLTDDIASSEATEEYSYKVKDNGFTNLWGLFGDRYKTKYSTRTTVKAGYVKNSLDQVISEVENLTEIEYRQNIAEWKKSLYKSLVSSARSVVDDDVLDPVIISRTIRGTLNSVKNPDINYSGSFPKELQKSGTLKGYEAEQFLSAAGEFARNLKSRVRSDVKSSVDALIYSFKSQDVANIIFVKYDEEINSLVSDIENKEQALDRYKLILKDVKNANTN